MWIAAALSAMALQATAANAPCPVPVWSHVLFGTDGRPVEYAIVDEDKYPAKFAENVKIRMARAIIQPPFVDGKPVESEYRLNIRLNTLDSAPEDFREDKFLRLLRSR